MTIVALKFIKEDCKTPDITLACSSLDILTPNINPNVKQGPQLSSLLLQSSMDKLPIYLSILYKAKSSILHTFKLGHIKHKTQSTTIVDRVGKH